MRSVHRSINGRLAFYRLGTFCLISSLAITSQYFILWPALQRRSLLDWLPHVGLFNIGIFYIFWTFYLSIEDPGRVSPTYLPPQGCSARYCKTCQNFKPPRTRHCRQCNRCILKMDHHCPWLSGCVGFYNQAVFVQFLGWVVPTTGYLGIIMIRTLLDIYQTTGLRTDLTLLFVVIYNMVCPSIPSSSKELTEQVAACLACVFCFCLFVWQLWCISENITTVETLIKKRADAESRKYGLAKVDFPYDLYSVRANLAQVFGPCYYHPWRYLWSVLFVPAPPADGHLFPVNEDAKADESWPPPLPTDLVESSAHITKAKVQTKQEELLRRREGKHKTTSREAEDSEEDYSYEEYARMGMMHDSDGTDSDDYPDGDDESFGVDDSEEATRMDDFIGQANMTLAELIADRRKKLNTASKEL